MGRGSFEPVLFRRRLFHGAEPPCVLLQQHRFGRVHQHRQAAARIMDPSDLHQGSWIQRSRHPPAGSLVRNPQRIPCLSDHRQAVFKNRRRRFGSGIGIHADPCRRMQKQHHRRHPDPPACPRLMASPSRSREFESEASCSRKCLHRARLQCEIPSGLYDRSCCLLDLSRIGGADEILDSEN